MTPDNTTLPNLAALMQACDESGQRRDTIKAAYETMGRALHDADLEHDTLMRALMLAQVTPEAESVETPAAEIAPSERCAAAIAEWIGRLGFDGVSESDVRTVFLDEYKPRTIKAALKHLVESDALKWWPEDNLFRTPEGSRKRHVELEAKREHAEEAAE